uniref:CCHC-type domain-containing protein n=1 Tax=Tanacetum cinerariifolium TaxID=118510 RepID=A0A6L2KJL5_TANCI|nr:hypothetical protein [Tanacetum cinerariifolium]
MTTSAIAISFDSSNESVGSSPSRVILFGDIPTVIPSTSVIAPETSAIAPVISSVAPVVETTIVASPTGLCGLVPYSDSYFNSPDEMASPEYITPLPATSPFYSPILLRILIHLRLLILLRYHHRRTRRTLMLLLLLVGGAGEAIPFVRPYRTHPNGPRKFLIARKRVGTIPAHRLAQRRASPRSSDHRSSSSSSSLDSSPVHSSGLNASGQAHSGSSTRVVSPRLGYPPVRAPRHSEAFCRWCAALLSTFYPLTTSESLLGDSSERPLHSSSHSARPSRKRCRSPADSVPSSALVMGSLAPTRADLLPPRKRLRDSYSPETSMEEDTKIETTETEDGRELDIVDGDDVRDRIEVDPRDDREEFEESAGDTVVLGIDSRSVPMVDEKIIEPVGGDSSSSSGTKDGTVRSVEDMPVDLDDAIRDFYHHMSEVRVDRIVGIETTQRQLEDDQMTASGERAGMAESIRSLRLENFKEEFQHIHDDRDDLRRKLRRTMTNTRSRMTPAAIEEMINRRVTEALEAHEINMNLRLENLNGKGNDGNGGNGNGRGRNRNGDGRGDRPVARECTYQDLMKCQLLNFKGTEGVVGLIDGVKRWKLCFTSETVQKDTRELMKLMTEVYCPRNKIQKMETELWNLSVKNNDKATYTQRFQELTMMCTKIVPEEEDRVGKFIRGLPDNIQGNVIATKPTRLQDAVRIANNLMDKKLKGYAVKNAENKMRFDTNHRDNRGQQPPFKRHNTGGQNVARAFTAGNNEKKDYEGALPYCNRCKLHHEGQCTGRFHNCRRIRHLARDCKSVMAGHYRKNCPKVKNQNHRNKARVPDTRGKAYVLGGGDANPGSNTVTGIEDGLDGTEREYQGRYLEKEYQERALLAKSKRFFKKGTQRFSSAKATDQTECHKCGKKGHFARDCWLQTSVSTYQSPFQPKPLSSPQHKPELRPTKDFEAKYNKVKTKDKEEVSSDDNDMVEVKVLMVLAEENDAISKEGAKNGDWVKNSMRKCISEQIPSLKKRILGVDLVFVKSSADDTKVTIPGVERPWLSKAKGFIQPNHNTGRILPAESQRNTTDPSVVVIDSLAIVYDSADESLVYSTPLHPLQKLNGAEPISGPKIIKLILRSKLTFKTEALKGVIINEPSSAPAKGDKSSSASKVHSAPAGQKDLVFVKYSSDDIKVTIPGVERPWLSKAEGFILPNHDTGRILPAESQRNTTDHSVAVTNSSATIYDLADESSVYSTPFQH